MGLSEDERGRLDAATPQLAQSVNALDLMVRLAPIIRNDVDRTAIGDKYERKGREVGMRAYVRLLRAYAANAVSLEPLREALRDCGWAVPAVLEDDEPPVFNEVQA